MAFLPEEPVTNNFAHRARKRQSHATQTPLAMGQLHSGVVAAKSYSADGCRDYRYPVVCRLWTTNGMAPNQDRYYAGDREIW
jgi:hypothetical protein